ncbi:MAG: TIGR02147 family protein [Pseudobdellovibrionaceae bacterium]
METTSIAILESEYKKRKTKNASYSLRAFAKLLGTSSGRLSQYFSGKRKITPQAAEKMASSLNLSPSEKNRFMRDTVLSNGRSSHLNFIENPKKLELDQFEVIADPLHFELLSLIETENFSSEVSWISRRLSKNPIEIRSALNRLKRLNLIKIEDSKISLINSEGVAGPSDVGSGAIRKAHNKNLRHAIACLEETTVDERDYSTMTLAIDPERLETAKEMIRVFRRTLCGYLENGNKKEVYRLNVNLVPVTKRSSK